MALIIQGKTKQIFSTENENEILIKFKDKCSNKNIDEQLLSEKETIASKLNEIFFFHIDNVLPTHIIKYNEDNSFIAKKLDIIPLKVVIRNFSAGTICERKGYGKNEWFPYPFIEYFYNNKESNLPCVTEEQIVQSGFMNYEAIDKIVELTRMANDVIKNFLVKKNLLLVDLELEFGVDSNVNIIIADEISPYNVRISHQDSDLYWDKDVFRNECSKELIEHYSKLADIVGV